MRHYCLLKIATYILWRISQAASSLMIFTFPPLTRRG